MVDLMGLFSSDRYNQSYTKINQGSCMNPHDRIIVDPQILVGKPIVKGKRLSVDFLLGLLAQGWSEAENLRNYPGLVREDLISCWAYASEVIRE